MAIIIDFDKIYKSNSCGDFIITESLGRDSKSRLFVKIKFLQTGTEMVTRYDIAIAGKVRDELYDIDFNHVYYSKYYGPYKIIKYIGRNNESKKIVRIRFINTGYEYDVLLRVAKDGNVKDKTISSNQIYMDKNINQIMYDDFIIDILKNRWKSMMNRCYKEKDSKYHEYGALGVSVCDRWHNFENYISDIYLVDNFYRFYNMPQLYHLDKDYKQLYIPKQYRMYSVNTCIFLSVYDNANLAILEKHNPNEYYGIRKLNSGNYSVLLSVDGTRLNLGTYSNIIAAANVYNYYYQKYSKAEIIKLINENVEYMSLEETKKYLISK